MSEINPRPFLPRCLEKHQLVTYLSITTKVLWSSVLTDELLESWGYDWDEIKALRIYDPLLTRRICLHYRITDLNADFSQEIKEALRSQAVS